MYRISLSGVELIKDRSDPLMQDACEAGFDLAGCMDVGLSPIALALSEAWKPLLGRLSERYGYCWEWVCTDSCPAGEYYARRGEAVLTKVG